jgi:hypothetical protein
LPRGKPKHSTREYCDVTRSVGNKSVWKLCSTLVNTQNSSLTFQAPDFYQPLLTLQRDDNWSPHGTLRKIILKSQSLFQPLLDVLFSQACICAHRPALWCSTFGASLAGQFFAFLVSHL